MENCRYCRAEVSDGLMGYHYAGYQQPACPDVLYAFGPVEPKRRKAINPQKRQAYPLPGENAIRGPYGHNNQTDAERRARHRAENERWRHKVKMERAYDQVRA
jgi:hypothetical protein